MIRARDPAHGRRAAQRSRRASSTAPGEVTGVQIDSRRVQPGDLFVAVGDGAEFSDDARERGAAATLVPHDDAFAALAAIAGGSPRAERRAGRRHHRLDRQDVDEGHPRRALRSRRAHGRRRGGASTTSSACRSRSAGSSRTRRSASSSWACAASARSPSSARIARPDIGVITAIGPVAPRARRLRRGRRALEGGAARRAARRAGPRSCRTTPPSSTATCATT